MKINDTSIGPGNPAYIVAEMSANHGGKFENAVKLLKAIKKSGANAVKLQTYTPETITLNSQKKDFVINKNSKWYGYQNLHNLYSEAHTPYEWHKELFDVAKSLELDIFSSPFSEDAVDLLESLSCPAYKIASAEINHIPLLRRVAQTRKPVILSTGLARLEDIENAIRVLNNNGTSSIIVLKCTTQYPAEDQHLSLLSIGFLRDHLKTPIGFSDHTLGNVASLGAVALGANMIEKHFTLEANSDSVDSFFSMPESEFSRLVRDIRSLECALGSYGYELPEFSVNELVARRSIYVSAPIKKGEIFSVENVRCVRPGYSLDPKFYEVLIGSRSKRNFELGDRIGIDDFEQ
jgi:N-acetylneuraminate synthase/pseudaminic acid synthase